MSITENPCSTVKKYKINGVAIFLALLLVVYIFPFLIVLINTFKSKSDIIKQPLSLMGNDPLSVNNYLQAIDKMHFWRVLWNSTWITAVSVVLIIVFSSMAAYLFARTDWHASKLCFALMIASMAVPFQVLMIPLVSVYGASLNLLNSPWTLIFMHIGFGVSMGMFLFHGAIRSTIPLAMEEAATIDGCGRFGIFFRIVFPLLRPTALTLLIIDSLAIWNDYLLPSLVLGKNELYTIPIAARVFHGTYSSDYGLMMAGLVLSVIPILACYLILQKYIIDGVVSGAVKG